MGHSHVKYQTNRVKSVPANFHTDKTGPGREGRKLKAQQNERCEGNKCSQFCCGGIRSQ